jgi:hypothetical protein
MIIVSHIQRLGSWLFHLCLALGHNLSDFLEIMLLKIRELCILHLNFSDDDMVVHNIYGTSYKTKSAQLAWS